MPDPDADCSMFERWRKGVDQIVVELPRLAPLIDHVRLNEPAMVSILAAGAARVGYTPIMEVNITKTGHSFGEQPKTWSGRSDLMLSDGKNIYAFEFKLSWPDSNSGEYDRSLAEATGDAACLSNDNYEHRYAGIASSYSGIKGREDARAYQKCDHRFISPLNASADTGLIVMFRKVK